MKKREKDNKQKRDSKVKGKKFIPWMIGLLVILLGVMLFLICDRAGLFYRTAKISLVAADTEIIQGEKIPSLTAKVKTETEHDGKVVLDKKKKYKAKDLIAELEKGENYTVVSDADPAVEGQYEIRIELDRELQEKLNGVWKDSVKLEIKNAKLHVKNPVGEWEDSKFKRYDGTYIENDFVTSMGKKYYLDGEGNKVTGWQTIDKKLYCFDAEGIMQTGWQTNEGAKYYLAENGAALKDWQTIEDSTYYFGEDGKMATGEVEIGLSKCTFDKDGKLVSKTLSKADPSKPMVALTFDDGPGPRTGEILTQLEKHNARATFFILGQKIASNPSVLPKMVELGCELGNHSYTHKDLARQSAKVVKSEIDDTNSKISKVAGENATVMRPPYGSIGGVMKEQIKMPLILWNIDTLDWKTRNAKKTIDTVMNNVKDGDIILMHDIHSESVDAALKLIPMLQEAGYQLVTVSELATAKGETLANGEKYTDF